MEASKAREISADGKMKIDKIIEIITQCAANGDSACAVYNMHPDAMPELMKLGYSVKMRQDPIMGTDFHVVSW